MYKRYTVRLLKTARKGLDKIPDPLQRRIAIALLALAENPLLGKPLRGDFSERYSLRVWPYRIIYRFFKEELVIDIIDIAHRQGVYK